ncbi:ApbA-domain-containing protein [Pseudoneurospora amorphoporcata]|uniref:ApbA-domain-containing protein n=1 Tax=Pseudoneurospora amorphoporcata TaxID=241081 RepID=A0AAN6NXJ0_9PEZI|nr:ApbA-domain-containing protein [Pseudoneurospora amorphoporcata]
MLRTEAFHTDLLRQVLRRGFCTTTIKPYHELPVSSVKAANLYSFTGSRPHLRVFGRIPCRHTRWCPSNTSVGRGASASGFRSIQPDVQIRSFLAISPPLRDLIPRASHPQVAPYPLQKTRQASSEAHSRLATPDAPLPKRSDAQVPSETVPKPVADGGSEPEVAKEQYRNPTKEFFDKLEEAALDEQKLAQTIRKEGEKKPWTDLFQPSDLIHVMGLNVQGRYVTHTLAGAETIPPPIFMINRRNLLQRWVNSGKCLRLHRQKQVIVRDRIKAEFTLPIQGHDPRKQNDKHISNLIVTVPAGHTVEALGQINHRLDHNSTIVLIHEGLGVAEAICKAYFPIESQRPVFILGHMTTRLGLGDETFEFGEVRPGRLYLTVYTPQSENIGPAAPFVIKKHPPTLYQRRGSHLIKLLTSIPELNATGHRTDDFLQLKLPAVAFRAVVDPLATILDSTYDKIPENPHARQLMDKLLSEVADVVSHLPELKGLEQFRVANALPFMRSEVFHRLKRKGTSDSPMRRLNARGKDTDIGFVTGYFVMRGKKLGLSVNALESIWSAIRAKHQVMAEKRMREVPFEVPYRPKLLHHVPEPWTNYPDRLWPEPLKNLLNKIR